VDNWVFEDTNATVYWMKRWQRLMNLIPLVREDGDAAGSKWSRYWTSETNLQLLRELYQEGKIGLKELIEN